MDPRFVVAAIVALSSVAHADRIVHVQRDGLEVRPGINDAREGTSSIAKRTTTIPPWTTSDEVWNETVACLHRVYAPFAVTITEEDPGAVPHIAAVFGGSPLLLELPRSNAGISPFAGDCSIIESSIVFAFTDILPPDAASACRVMAQEIGHSYGLDHELRPGDPMSVESSVGERAFVDEEVACGEDTARPCGLPGRTCRAMQSSYGLLAARLGLAGEDTVMRDAKPDEVDCSTGHSTGWLTLVALSTWIDRVRARRRAARAPR